MVSLKKITRKVLGKSGSKALGTAIDSITGGTGSKLFLNGDSYLQDTLKKYTGMDGQQIAANLLLGTIGNNILGNNNILSSITSALGINENGNNNILTSLLGTGINWGNSIFSAQQAKEQAKYNSELNYKYQTKLNEQGYAHDKEILGIQQAYDREMANTAVQRQMADLQAAGINPAMASQLGGAGGGGLGGGSSLGGGSAQTDKANWLAYNLEKAAGQRDAQRVAIEQANSAKSAEVADKGMEKTNAEIAKMIVETGLLPKQAEAQITQSLAQAGKAHAETAVAQANKDKIETGRWQEIGLPMAKVIAKKLGDIAEDKTYEDKGKKVHWYGIRKDGK